MPWLPCQAQERPSRPQDFEINNVRQFYRNAPSYGASASSLGGNGSWSSDQWLIIDVDFGSDLEWADDIQLKFFVLIGERASDAKLLTGQLSLLNVEKGSRHFAAMFVHPSTLKRYGRGKVKAVAVQLFHQNRLMAQESDPKTKQRWWEQYSPSPGFLLTPAESPWSVLGHERYEAIRGTP